MPGLTRSFFLPINDDQMVDKNYYQSTSVMSELKKNALGNFS